MLAWSDMLVLTHILAGLPDFFSKGQKAKKFYVAPIPTHILLMIFFKTNLKAKKARHFNQQSYPNNENHPLCRYQKTEKSLAGRHWLDILYYNVTINDIILFSSKGTSYIINSDIILNNPRLAVYFEVKNLSLICWWIYTFGHYCSWYELARAKWKNQCVSFKLPLLLF